MARAFLATGALLLGGSGILLSTLGSGQRPTRHATWALTHASRLLLRALGIRLSQRGGPRSGASLIVANHVSWLDVLVLASAGSMLPVAKAEIAQWPFIGFLARRSGALFIKRDRLSELPAHVDRIAVLLRQGHRVQVFPEATTRCGTTMAPFRRAAFQAAIDAAVVISPVAISYRDAAGNPVMTAAFVGETSLVTSVMRVLRAHPFTAVANWLPVVPAIVATGTAATDRARAAAAAERTIARTLHQRVLHTRGQPGQPNYEPPELSVAVRARGRSELRLVPSRPTSPGPTGSAYVVGRTDHPLTRIETPPSVAPRAFR